jgi:hypothetical protein
MCKVFRQIASLFLALIVMMSTLSFTISKHYCSNILVDTAIIQPAKTCGMHDKNHDKKERYDNKDDCCDEDVKLIEGQDELKVSSLDFNLDIPVQIAVFSIIYHFPEIYTFKGEPIFNSYKPPEYACDFQILHQVFLI